MWERSIHLIYYHRTALLPDPHNSVTMGQTNIRSAGGLLQRAGSEHDQVAVVPEAGGRAIHLDGRDFSNEELLKHSHMLSRLPGCHDRWLHFSLEGRQLGDGETSNTERPLPYSIPRVSLTSGLREFWISGIQKVGTSQPAQPEGLVFFAVIQGQSGSAAKKVHFADSQIRLSTIIFNEMINGYATVFSGAAFKTEIERARDLLEVKWEKVTECQRLFELRKENETCDNLRERVPVIGVFC
jgi:hypothetical protein